MNWDAIGAIAEGVGALAVVATLVYLSVQVRYAKAASADTNRLMRAAGVREMTLALFQNDDARTSTLDALGVRPFFEASADELGISCMDAERIDYVAQFYFWLHWGQYKATLTDGDVQELENVIRAFYTFPAIRHSWEHSPFGKAMLEPAFVGFVDAVLARHDAALAADART